MNKYISRVVAETKPLPKSARVRQAYSMHKMGKTYAYIADILGVSRNRAYQMVTYYVERQA
jgi:NADH:ubiquinone oxidoreductase subunit E